MRPTVAAFDSSAGGARENALPADAMDACSEVGTALSAHWGRLVDAACGAIFERHLITRHLALAAEPRQRDWKPSAET